MITARNVMTGRIADRWLGYCAAAFLSLLLVLAPRPVHAAAFPAKDADAIGKWAGDAKDPTSFYEVAAGPRPGELRLISPPAEHLAPIALHRVAADAFASASGATPIAKLTLTTARHAHLDIHGGVDKKRIVLTFLLLDKQ